MSVLQEQILTLPKDQAVLAETRILKSLGYISDDGGSMYRIGQLAQMCGVKADTLRFYEKHGLLIPSMRTESGYRMYTKTDVNRLKFILKAKTVGFTLGEITDLLSIEKNKSQWACADVKSMVDDKLAQVEVKIAELNVFRDTLKTLSQACCGGSESAEHCSILAALESSLTEVNEIHADHQCRQIKARN